MKKTLIKYLCLGLVWSFLIVGAGVLPFLDCVFNGKE